MNITAKPPLLERLSCVLFKVGINPLTVRNCGREPQISLYTKNIIFRIKESGGRGNVETDRYKDKMMLSAYKAKERRQQKAFWRKAEARERGN